MAVEPQAEHKHLMGTRKVWGSQHRRFRFFVVAFIWKFKPRGIMRRMADLDHDVWSNTKFGGDS